MSSARPSLRARLAILGFLAAYLPVIVLLGVSASTEASVVVDGQTITEGASSERSPWIAWTAIALAPVAAAVAWQLAGRSVRPVEQAMADQQRLIDEASHELRAPLTVLRTNVDVLLAHPEPTLDVYREGLERTKAAAIRMQDTIDELLVGARSRNRRLDGTATDLVALAAGVVDELRPVADATGVRLEVSGVPGMRADIDAPMVARALANLVRNAVAAAPSGSAVAVGVRTDGAHHVVVVTDHGPGIPAEHLEDVFERGWQADPGRGDGLGLTIARHVATAHGGTLVATSPGPSGDGAVFVLRLPRGESG